MNNHGKRQINKCVVITGASRGIGLATAKFFLENEFGVINLSRTLCQLPEVINIQVDLAQQGFEKNLETVLPCHLTNAETIVLVHNAAQSEKDTVNQIQADSLRKILEVNVVAPTILNRIVLPLMNQGSAIIYIGSTLSEKAVAGSFSYITSKHAMVGLMRVTCQDLMDKGIHTACICPGATDTQMLRTVLNNDAILLEQVKSMNAQHRLIEPTEIAQTIYFVATQPVLNGAVIHANLGQKEK